MRNWNGQLPIHYAAMLGKKCGFASFCSSAILTRHCLMAVILSFVSDSIAASTFPSEARFSFLERFISRNVPVKSEISSNVGDGDVESLAESPIGSAEGRQWFTWFQGYYNFKAMAILSEPFFTAARVGLHEVVVEILVACPDMIYSLDEVGHTTLGIAVMNCDIDIFNLTSWVRYAWL
ncbi:hypothetical protein RHMOL_Rhmol07G0118100 [Rhododendron molle]|uniref:Uncharacterized protein n=1 Tax=Rhododendron molle TaxID=49168 RepID=A0ACC0MZW2_RHOML|nr:hypothetical protein RHMOL_Rhmol07G0118100 [Rhododendron molle]